MPPSTIPGHCLHERFEAQADATADAVAATFDGRGITYGELDRSSTRLARTLQKLGVGPEVLVGVCVRPSIPLLSAILGVLKAGGAYVPLDPEYPKERLAFMVEDARPRVLVTESDLEEALPSRDGPVVRLDADREAIAAEPADRLGQVSSPEHLAYVVYTSGSTGRPKGVMVSHANVARLFEVTRPCFRFDATDVWTAFHSFAFDFSVWEMWGALLHGGRLVVVPPEVRRSAPLFRALIRDQRVTVLSQTPSAFRQIFLPGEIDCSPAEPLALRLVFLGGEALDQRDLVPWWAWQGDRGPAIYDMYGITETTVHVTCHEVRPIVCDGAPPDVVGRPLSDLAVHILDEAQEPVPAGERGEIYVGGAGTSRGYLGRPALTAERFLPDPFPGTPGARLYRTGDLGRILPSGEIEYLGRADDQVKIRGFRIELAEVEAALSAHPAVGRALVVAREDASGHRRLVAYIVPRPGEACTATSVRRLAEERLPGHMVPSAFVCLPVLPLTHHGKVDRRALPPPGGERPDLACPYEPPRTPAEHALATLWSEVLGVAPIGVDDGFFELGGDSLLAMQIASRVAAAFQVEPSIRGLLESSTIRSLARQIEPLAGAPAPPRARAPRAGPLPLSFAQQRLWFLHELSPESTAYNLPVEVRLSGPLDVAALERSLRALSDRHEVLRTTFHFEDDGPVQTIHAEAVMPALPTLDLAAKAGVEQQAQLSATIEADTRPPFDLGRGPLFRTRLVRLGETEHVLVLVLHQIVCDGWSLAVMERELSALYAAFSAGRPSTLPALPLQYADHAAWQRRWLHGRAIDADLAYWRRQLEGATPFRLPADRPRPRGSASRGEALRFRVPAGAATSLRALARSEAATPFMAFLAAFAASLHARTGAGDIVVGTPIAGRRSQEVEGLIGFFVNTLVIRARVREEASFRALLAEVRERTLEAYDHQDVPFDRLVEHLAPARGAGDNPLFHVMFVFQTKPSSGAERAGGVSFRFSELHNGAAPFDLTWQLWDTGTEIEGVAIYDADLFAASTIARLVKRYILVLEEIAAQPDRAVHELARRSGSAPAERMAPEQTRAALLQDPRVEDCAVCVRRGRPEPELVAYVVPTGPLPGSDLAARLPPHLAPTACVPISAVPLTDEGAVDEELLRRLEVIDDDLRWRWEERLLAERGVEGVAVVVQAPHGRPAPLRVSDLLPSTEDVPDDPQGMPLPGLAAGGAPVVNENGAPLRPAWSNGGPLVIPGGEPRTLDAALLRAADSSEKGLRYVEADGSAGFQSYASLAREARAVLSGLRDAGLGPGDRAILQVDSLRGHFTAFWACVLGGIAPVTVAIAPSYEARGAVVDKLHHAWQLLERPILLTSRRLAPALAALGAVVPMEGARVAAIEDLAESPPTERVHERSSADVAFLQLTSGSTGAAKCVQVTDRGVVCHVHGTAQLNGYRPDDVSLSWFPLDHVAAILLCHLTDLFLCRDQIQVATERFLAEPLLWLELLEAHRVTHTASPNFGFKLVSDRLAASPLRSYDLSSIRAFANGGEQATGPVMREFMSRVAAFGVPPGAMVPAFGMAEACTGITYNNGFDPGADGGRAYVDLGPPIPGVEIRIVDADGRLLPEEAVGRMQVRGEVVTPGYLGNAQANHEAFVGDGWFDTGDLASLDGGHLIVVGRRKETIVVRGASVSCHELEAAVDGVEGVRPTLSVACPVADPSSGTEGFAIFFVPEDLSIEARARLARTIRGEVTRRFGIAPTCVVPLSEAEIPRTTSGKKQRTQLAQALGQGRFQRALEDIDRAREDADTLPDWFYRKTWRRREAGRALPSFAAGASTVVLTDGGERGDLLCHALRASGCPTVAVEAGARFAVLAGDRFTVDPGDAESLARLFAALSVTGRPIERVVHLWTFGAPQALETAEALERAQVAAGHGLLAFIQALARSGAAAEAVRMLIVSSHTQPVSPGDAIAWERAPVPGLIPTIAAELSWIDCRHLDLAPGAPEADVDLVLREMAVAEREREVAYRDGRRLVARLEKVDFAATRAGPPPFQRGGVYLVTGGLGGIGVEIARYLMEEHRARLLVIGRTRIGSGEGAAEPRARALEALRSAARDGAQVSYEAVDVCDLDALRGAVERAEARWGSALAGVVHLAGVAEERMLMEETAESFAAALRPKGIGTWALQRILDDRPGALFVGFSSVHTTFGGLSLGAYAAANRSLEHLFHEIGRAGATRSYCLAWSGWEGVGMGRRAPGPHGGAGPLLPVPARQGIASLLVGLRHDQRDLLVGLDAGSRQVLRRSHGAPPRAQELAAYVAAPPALAAALAAIRIEDRFGTPAPCRIRRVDRLPRTASGEVDIGALLQPERAGPRPGPALVAPEGVLPALVASAFRDALGVERVGMDDNFFDLGGHSLLLARVRARLESALGRTVPVLDLFRYPTVRSLAAHLGEAKDAEGARAPPHGRRRTSEGPGEPIAIIGMSGRFPGASDVEMFWKNLREGVESITFFSDERLAAAGVPPELRHDPRYVGARGCLSDVERFDAAFFGMSPAEARVTDPQHRLFLECAWEALERAGHDPARFPGPIGVFAGSGSDGYRIHHLLPSGAPPDDVAGLAALLGNEKDYLATRVAYRLDLKGPSLTIQTACSTSLVAVHLARQSLLAGECDMALAGGVSIAFPLGTGYVHQPGHILSPDGHCRAFDARAAGTLGGDGAGVVVLRRLSDALADGDHVHAVIRGAAVNNDGAAKIGFTAPSVEGQARVIAAALAAGGVHPDTIGYVEAHGTGTPLGDPIEIAALAQAFRAADPAAPASPRRGPCAVGSLKTNVGHLNAAAGIASLIKATLTVEHGEIPPSLHFTAPNPAIDFAGSPFHVNAALSPFSPSSSPRRAGVSAFGFGGTNAHVVLEEAPPSGGDQPSRPWHLLTLSARSAGALDRATASLAAHLARDPVASLADVAYTSNVGRRAFALRRAVVCKDIEDAVRTLEAGSGRAVDGADDERGERPIVFMFPGQGAHYPGMAAGLYKTEATFRQEVDRCAELLVPHLGRDLRQELFSSGEASLARTALAQPALFVVEIALARLWMSWGVRPSAMIGHSLGEYVAACLAGVFSLEEALRLVAARGRRLDRLQAGGMLAVPLPEGAVEALLPGGVSLAAVNAPSSCVVSGPPAELEAFERRLAEGGTRCRRLKTSHAFHSAMMDPAMEDLSAAVLSARPQLPSIPYLSNLTGTWVTGAGATDPRSWAEHARRTVRFSAGLTELLADERRIFLEVGPGRTLTALVAQHRAEATATACLPSEDARGTDVEVLLGALGRLWTAGASVDWASFHAGQRRRRVPLPTYPFERRRHFVDLPPSGGKGANGAARPLDGAAALGHEPAIEDALPRLDDVEAEIHASLSIRPLESREGVAEGLAALCSSHVHAYLQASGIETREGAVHRLPALRQRLGVLPEFERFIDAMIEMLREDGIVHVEGDEVRFARGAGDVPSPRALGDALRRRAPDLEGLVDFVDHCAKSYEDALSGRVEAIGVLYPGGSSKLVEDCERRTVEHRSERACILLLREAVLRISATSPARALRVLEVGGGAGALTWVLCEALRGRDVAYHFTDLGRTFVNDARLLASRRGLDGLMTFGQLDISKDPRDQGYAGQTYDFIVADNVVHATRDVRAAVGHLRDLLAPGGTLALVEATKAQRWDTLTWGLAEGWWYYEDDVRRGSPLLHADQWERVLREAGFAQVAAYPRAVEARARTDHGLLVARGRADPAERASEGPRGAADPRPGLRVPYVAPRDELERAIAAACQEILGIERVGVQDNFFELGADSLIMLRLTDRLSRSLGREVPAQAAFQGMTVERMARALSATSGARAPQPPAKDVGRRSPSPPALREDPRPDATASSPLVPIQPGGSRPPLFFVHPAAGVVFPYFDLARKLGPEQPFYGLQALGLDGMSKPDLHIEDMARHYVEALRRVQPRGPYYLGGFSFGTLVAFEMAQQLAQAGRGVGLLALVDEPAPLPGYRPGPTTMARLMLTGVARTIWPHLHDYLYLARASERRRAEPSATPDTGLLQTFLARAAMANFVPPESRLLALRQPAMIPMAQLFLIHAQQTLAYVPSAYPHRITLFKVRQPGLVPARDPTLGWSLLAAGGVDVHDVPGEHLTLLREPHVSVLAAKLSACLAAVRKGADAARPAVAG